jgi:hypothetical protein
MKEVDTMTYIEALNVAIANLNDAEAVEKLTALRDQHIKRASAERKPTPKQVENAGFKADVLAWMEPDTLYTAADIVKGVPSVVAAGISTQRVSAMLTQLVNDGSVIKTEDKRKHFYSLA